MHVVVSVTVNTVEMCLKAFINLLLPLYIQPGADRAAYLETFGVRVLIRAFWRVRTDTGFTRLWFNEPTMAD